MQKEIWHRFNATFVSLVKHLLPRSGSLHRHDTMQIYQLQRQSTSYRDGLTSNHDGFTIDHDGLTSNHHGESLPVTIMVDLTRHDVYTSYQDGLTNYYISCRNQTEAKTYVERHEQSYHSGLVQTNSTPTALGFGMTSMPVLQIIYL